MPGWVLGTICSLIEQWCSGSAAQGALGSSSAELFYGDVALGVSGTVGLGGLRGLSSHRDSMLCGKRMILWSLGKGSA